MNHPYPVPKVGIDGIGAILERMAIRLAKIIQDYEYQFEQYQAGVVPPAPTKLIDGEIKRMPADVWLKMVEKDLNSKLRTAQNDAIKFMRALVQHRKLEADAGKSVTREDKKEFFVSFFKNELSEVERKELIARITS